MISYLENLLIFYPDRHLVGRPDVAGLEYEDVFFNASDGVKLHGWIISSEPGLAPKTWLLFLHGNAGNISHRLENVSLLVSYGFSVFIIDYRGYGRSSGRPSEKGLYRDASAAFDYLAQRPDVNLSELIVFGRSLGGAVATELCRNRKPAGLIVESSFTSIRDMAGVHFPFIPKCLVSDMFNSLSKVEELTVPALFVHGENDELIPFQYGRRLFDAYGGLKEFYPIPRSGHNDTYIVGGSAYFEKLKSFAMKTVTGNAD